MCKCSRGGEKETLTPIDWCLIGVYELALKVKRLLGFYEHCPKCSKGELKKWANFDWDKLKITNKFKKCDKCGFEEEA